MSLAVESRRLPDNVKLLHELGQTGFNRKGLKHGTHGARLRDDYFFNDFGMNPIGFPFGAGEAIN